MRTSTSEETRLKQVAAQHTMDNVITLLPDHELCDVRISFAKPSLYYAIPIEMDALVTINFKEFSSVSHCTLLMSFVDSHPTSATASWEVVSPESHKRVVIHPADYNYAHSGVGAAGGCAATDHGKGYRGRYLYLSVRYLDAGGSSFFRLMVHLDREFYSVWFHRKRSALPLKNYLDREDLCSVLRPSSHVVSLWNRRLLQVPSDTTAAPITGEAGVRLLKGEGSLNVSRGAATDHRVCTQAQSPESFLYSELYIGSWKGRHPHGRGVVYYALHDEDSDLESPPARSWLKENLLRTVQEHHDQAWSALTLPQDPTLGGTAMNDTFLAALTGIEDLAGLVAAATAQGRLSSTISQKTHDTVSNNAAASPRCSSPLVMSFSSIIRVDPDRRMEAYDGEWAEGKKHGCGVYRWVDSVYIGAWKDGLRHGLGLLLCQDDSWYCGMWEGDRRHGYGEAFLQPEGLLYKGEWIRGFRDGTGSLTYPNGVVASGTWSANEIKGEVRAQYPDGAFYEGGWKDGARHGTGNYTDAAGRVHRCQWNLDRQHGSGTTLLLDGVRFEGQWADGEEMGGVYRFPNGDTFTGGWDKSLGLRQGHGCCVYRNGDVYEGEWQSGKRHGQGTMHYKRTGAVYCGAWLHDKRHGQGTLTKDDETYEGGFEADERSGIGTQREADGSVFTGNWRHDHHAGAGVLYDATKDVTYTGIFLYRYLQGHGTAVQHSRNMEHYDGSWLDGEQHGKGTLELANGDVIRGVWHRGQHQNGSVEHTTLDGSHYVGEWNGNCRCGHGTEVLTDGSVYEGEWVNNKPCGYGRLTKPDGESVECNWVDGVIISGPGTLTFPDGSVYSGEQREGVPQGNGVLTYPDGTVFQGTFQDGVYFL